MKANRLSVISCLVLLCGMALSGCSGGNGKSDSDTDSVPQTDSAAVDAHTSASPVTPAKSASVFDQLASDMVYVDGGTFIMGEGGNDASNPAHSVTLSGYRICRYEVNQRLWTKVMGSNPSDVQDDSLPVVNVSWDDCQSFISKLNELTGKKYRLPTEAEWEYACRGGKLSKGYKYSGGNDICAVAWYDADSNGAMHPVGEKAANELWLYDMSGNVWEWCQDWYAPYTSEAQTNPTGPANGTARVCRGGSFIESARYSLPTLRNSAPPTFSINSQGFRLAL